MEEPKLIAVPYITVDGQQQSCERTIVVDAAKTTVIGDITGERVLLEDGVLFGNLNLFMFEFNGKSYGSDTMTSTEYLSLVNACCEIPQTITFGAPASKIFGDAPFTLAATSTSGLTVTFTSSDPTVISISGTTATVVGAGTANITAHQAGDSTYAAASPVTHAVVVAKEAQTITFGALSSKAFASGPVTLAATTTSGLTISYTSSNTAVATIVGNILNIVGVGSANITASQAGNANFNAATPVVQAQVITKANQTITFGALTTQAHTVPPFALTGTASSGLAVTYTSGTPSVATVSGSTLTPLTAGSTVITAAQAGNANYNAATSVPQTQTLT
jgi:hypothetical protein